jgi:hypothetical protein
MKPAGLLDIQLPSVELVDRPTDPAALTTIQKEMMNHEE